MTKFFQIILAVCLLSADAFAQHDRNRGGGGGGRSGGGERSTPAPDRSRERTPDRQPTPDRNRERTPDRQPTPDRNRERTPDRQPTPDRNRERTPDRQPTPDRNRERTPDRQPTPDRNRERTPDRQPTPDRNRERTPDRQPTPDRNRERTPDRQPTPDRNRDNRTNDRHAPRQPNNAGRDHRDRPGRRYEETRQVNRNNRVMVERHRRDVRRQQESIRYYNQRVWGRHQLDCYYHYYTYNPVFWGYYRSPYANPWYYTWGWRVSPWYASWGWYYSPYPYYQSPSYWVTDYVISEMLREQYEDGYEDGYKDGLNAGRSPINQSVKEQIRRQVDQTADNFQNDNDVALQQALQDPNYLFIVDNQVSVLAANNTTCQLSGGDILKTVIAPSENVGAGRMVVVTSKGDSCAAGTQVVISIEDLQEMINSFSEKVDDGLQEVQRVKSTIP